MRAVVTRVSSAAVEVDGRVVAALAEPGLLVLVGTTHDDTADDAATLARKLWGLRILADERSAQEAGAPLLVVSQFTLYGDARKGRRPSWSRASGRAHAEPLIESFVAALREAGAHVETGVFGAMMRVSSVNEGPFTVLLDTAELA